MDPRRYMEQRQKNSAPRPQPVQEVNTAQPQTRPQQTSEPAVSNPQPEVKRVYKSQQQVQPENRGQSVVQSEVHPPYPPVQPKTTVQNQTGRIYQTKPQRAVRSGKLEITGKRFFGQILIDRWVMRVNGEKYELSFGNKGKLTLDLPAGIYPVTAYTPYLGMRCMRVSGEVEVKPDATVAVTYKTVFDIFKEGLLLHENNRIS